MAHIWFVFIYRIEPQRERGEKGVNTRTKNAPLVVSLQVDTLRLMLRRLVGKLQQDRWVGRPTQRWSAKRHKHDNTKI